MLKCLEPGPLANASEVPLSLQFAWHLARKGPRWTQSCFGHLWKGDVLIIVQTEVFLGLCTLSSKKANQRDVVIRCWCHEIQRVAPVWLEVVGSRWKSLEKSLASTPGLWRPTHRQSGLQVDDLPNQETLGTWHCQRDWFFDVLWTFAHCYWLVLYSRCGVICHMGFERGFKQKSEYSELLRPLGGKFPGHVWVKSLVGPEAAGRGNVVAQQCAVSECSMFFNVLHSLRQCSVMFCVSIPPLLPQLRSIYVRERLIFASFLNQDVVPQVGHRRSALLYVAVCSCQRKSLQGWPEILRGGAWCPGLQCTVPHSSSEMLSLCGQTSRFHLSSPSHPIGFQHPSTSFNNFTSFAGHEGMHRGILGRVQQRCMLNLHFCFLFGKSFIGARWSTCLMPWSGEHVANAACDVSGCLWTLCANLPQP